MTAPTALPGPSDGWWCPTCQIHRTSAPTRLCPVCKDKETAR